MGDRDIENFLDYLGVERSGWPTLRLHIETETGIRAGHIAAILTGLDDAISYVNGSPISQDETWTLSVGAMSPYVSEITLWIISHPQAVPWGEDEAAVRFLEKMQDVIDTSYGNRFDGGRYEQLIYVLADTVLSGDARVITLDLDALNRPPVSIGEAVALKIRSDREAREKEEPADR